MTNKGITPEIARKIRAANNKEETNLQRIRVNKGLSQQALADISGVSKRAIEGYEQKYRNIDNAKLDILCDLASALDGKIEDILEDEELIKKLKATT